ncbi:N-acyl amino acid synthase FeeM domain-containing protein [Methyloversatilis discipulorum]|jgi:hypothetical protein|uniref:N-acyl amino acid synthase FeeM domain-containing protein n=1 Tax=Methyloversatilis discipulorum TaxID=1119528 RepID=UPI0003788A50|nr:hypothetical protein [Methyloversatilis discipulorum]PZU54439.1 MAG: hypothetical protein DI561_05075 [Thauera sp.]
MSPRTLHDAANDALFRPFPLLRPRPRLRAVAPPALQHAAALPVAIEFTIAADAADLAAAEALVVRCYGWRGYGVEQRAARQGETTLLARLDGDVVGTLTVRCGTRLRLQAEAGYAEHVGELRRQGRRLVEYTRFAIDRERALPDDLAPQLMRRALLLGHVALGATDCVIEVNPRHARYYRREFGFRECGPERTCERVGAPARLLHLDMVVPPACLAHDPRTPLH